MHNMISNCSILLYLYVLLSTCELKYLLFSFYFITINPQIIFLCQIVAYSVNYFVNVLMLLSLYLAQSNALSL